jgi:glycosyltransferase involved in cell wall biosynthesis
MNAMDIHVLSSLSEAFPNVIVEAMASGKPCAATDVGDTQEIIGNAEWVAPPQDPQMLAEAIVNVINTVTREGADVVGYKCRQRIFKNYSMERMVTSYRSLWRDLSTK